MAPTLRQSAYNSTSKRGDGDEGSVSLKATFSEPTLPGSLIIAIASTAGGLEITHRINDDDFELLRSDGLRDIQLSAWYQENAPSIESLTVSTIAYRSMQLRLLEYTGVAQDAALDRFTWDSDDDNDVFIGSTGTLDEAGELAIAVLVNQYSSTTQSGFTGGFTKLYENTSPSGDSDWEKSRFSVHSQIPNDTDSLSMRARLSSDRRWLGFIATFKSGIAGPARFTSTINTNVLRLDGEASLTVFGQLRSALEENRIALGEVSSVMARIGPFNYQYRLGGWQGLVIGSGTDYRVESVQGLEGWELRTSDDDLPRGDGALRGVDLQTARQILFKMNFDGTQAEIEEQADTLYRWLIPQRDSDWELIYRHPGRPLRVVYCRPTNLIREMDQLQLLLHNQSFTLRAADPRHYSAVQHVEEITVSSDDDNPTIVQVTNIGNAFAYPEIRLTVLPESDTVTRVELVNETNDSTFDFRAVIPARSTLIGDMAARATGAPRSIVTIDGQSKYGAWQFPREAFRLDPGVNNLYLRTVPEGAPVLCLLTYRDTWSG